MTTQAPNRDADPEKLEISMVVRETEKSITEWIEYTFNENFLSPVTGFSFTVGGKNFNELFLMGVKPGARISLRLDSHYVGDGYIDDVEYSADRTSGITARIEGRDRLGYAVDGHARPRHILKEGGTLGEAIKQILEPFGFTKFEIDNTANVGLQTGLVSGTPTSKGGKKKGPKPLAKFVLHQSKPYQGESAWAFASRLAQRHGVWLWLSADGETVIASKPNFDRPPSHTIRRTFDEGSNVLSGAVKYSVGEQPTVIIADGSGGGAEFGNSRLRAKMLNPTCITDDPNMRKTWEEYPDANVVSMGAVGDAFFVSKCRVLYLHDQSSQTPKQLENFVKREMSLFIRKSLQATYTVRGHGQLIGDSFVPWAVDTMVRVDDDVAGLHEALWVVGRTFTRSRQAGTTTRLELVRAHSLELGEADAEQAATKTPAKSKARPTAEVEKELEIQKQKYLAEQRAKAVAAAG